MQLAYQIAIHGRRELPLAPDEQAGFVMTLLRLHAFRPALASDDSPAHPRASANAATIAERSPASPSPASVSRAVPPAASPALSSSAAAVARPAPAAASEARAVVVPAAPIAKAAVAAVLSPPLTSAATGDWHEILATLNVGGMARELAQHCELRELQAGRIALRLAPAHRHLLMKPAQDKLQQLLAERFGGPLQLAIELEATTGETPAASVQRDRRQRQDRAIAAVEQDGFVREVIEMFDATLIESSIKPV